MTINPLRALHRQIRAKIPARSMAVAFGILTAFGPQSANALNPAVTVSIDVNANRHAISPQIYGLAYASSAQLLDLNVQLNRYGGNAATRYNWLQNADNRGFDWYFESIGDDSAVAGERGDRFIAQNKSAGADSMITIPMIDWIAKVGPNRSKLASFSIQKYGAQTGSDWEWFSDAGNGILSSTQQAISGNDRNDANVPNSAAIQHGWVQHMVGKWGNATNGGARFYMLDNESSIWHASHRDVQPVGATMSEIRDKMIAYAGAVKSVDPTAIVVGPEEWGWGGYFYSGYDQQWGAAHGWSGYPDRAAHGNMDYMPWLLDQMRQNEVATGKRLLDVFSLHIYPQNGEFGNDTSANMQALRNRSTRSLWDANYTDESWINDKVQLIPRMKNWVATYYPGLKTAITEYNWGAEGHINGATAQADILGIFGREGLDYAARWTTPDTASPTYKAIKLYRNADGNKAGFGDTSVSTVVPNPDQLAAFSAVRSSDGALTVMVINKIAGTTPLTLNLGNFNPTGVAQAWQLTSTNSITKLANQNLSGNSLTTTVPAQSITLFTLAAASTPPPSVLSFSIGAGGVVKLNWHDNSSGEQGFYIERATAGSNNFVRVGQVGGNVTSFSHTTPKGNYVYRVQAFNSGTGQVSAYSNLVSVKVGGWSFAPMMLLLLH
ncbi:MAG: glycoside hydrolase family 44 protein [Pseudomonadota bacterium]